ncbi:PREDICTED: uncharacterized protein LOC104800916 isoform X3 [Tarenaya hassleriana]|uniref:uncharacterized protein LOC104800916 isoform X3 n=1 Tax=Tarenaya hassleriana TaxID=28532 RepID=UPI00053C8BFB|nr:PREDICTED: uncharacterized protein LOC104800916 isoform X3 [Tarenaya hassleriana]
MWISTLKRVRRTIMVLGIANLVVVVSGAVLALVASPDCGRRDLFPLFAVCFLAGVKLAAMVKMGTAQELMAKSIMDSPTEINHERRLKYKTWLWWTRFAMVITVLQFIGATYLMFHVAKFVSHGGMPRNCVLGLTSDSLEWEKTLQVAFVIAVCFVALAQCFIGSDILQWRSFYTTQDDAWKAHYQEVFDHGIREVLCCLGRAKYMSVMEEDEVYSVARLLGDLVAYRASGTGHLEFLADLSIQVLLCCRVIASFLNHMKASWRHRWIGFKRLLASIDLPKLLTLRPKLDGDNWWRGHAAAFLKFISYPSHVLRRGRICREKCKATYFVVVLHYLRCVVIAVRGTETAEDLITDGLGRACPLTSEDLDGLINDFPNHGYQSMNSSFTHYGHSGIVEAARDLFMQIEGYPEFGESRSVGFLSSLLGAGCECEGYHIRIVGHSLGGAISSLLGIRLRRRFPNLHVYAFGPLPSVDSSVADTCSDFVTSIVLDNEFSSRLSVGSILRLQAASIKALAQDPKADTALIFRLARRFLYVSNHQRDGAKETTSGGSSARLSEESDHRLFQVESLKQDQVYPIWEESEPETQQKADEMQDDEFTNPFHNTASEDPVSEFMETVPSSEGTSADDPPEMFLPGLVIHFVPERDKMNMPIWRGWGICDVASDGYKAYVADRESFKDIVVSQSMFLDHLPWRCRHAIQKVLESRNLQDVNMTADRTQIV